MAETDWTAVDDYLVGTLVEDDDDLKHVLHMSRTAGLPPINVSELQGKQLQILAKMVSARNILEIGTLAGYSTIWLAKALPATGCIITIERDPKHAEVAAACFVKSRLDTIVDLRIGAALDVLPRLEDEGAGPFDFIFIDADQPNNPAYFRWALKLSRPGTVVVVDNVVKGGTIANSATTNPAVLGTREMLSMIAADPRADGTVFQTVGSKGYDGFAVAVIVR